MMLAYQPIRSLATINMAIYQGAAAAERVFDVIDTEANIKEVEGLPNLDISKSNIEFKNIAFSYPKTDEAAIKDINDLKKLFWDSIKVTGSESDFNQTLEKAGRVADFIELGHLMCVDALDREESCGAHARLEYLAESGDAMRDDENYGYVAAWEFNDDGPVLHKEHLDFEFIKPTYRDYK